MPLDFERITLNAIPDGDMPVFHASQFETMRPFIADLKWGTEDFAPGEDNWCTLSIRKNDDTLVIIDDIDVDNNTVSCILTQQSVACMGDNFCQLKVWGTEADEDGCIACLNFILHVQPDPEAGGITSESEISNLTQQIEDITQEVIGEDYYNKTEVDTLLAAKADSDSVYTKGETDTLLAAKADSDDVYTKSETYTQAEVDALIDNMFPTFTASGTIANFITALTKPLVSVAADVSATTVTACGVNLFDKESELMNGYIIDNTGEYRSSDSRKCTDFIPVQGGEDYKILSEQEDSAWGAWYDADKNYISACAGYYVGGSTVKTAPANARYVRLTVWSTFSGDVDTFGLNYPATDTSYHAYNGQTVPVSDATTLVTQSGVNNVFADVGDVTVQYKYMSM